MVYIVLNGSIVWREDNQIQAGGCMAFKKMIKNCVNPVQRTSKWLGK